MRELARFDRGDVADRHVLVVSATDRGDGDVHPRRTPAEVLEARQRALTGCRWDMVDQVHGTDVVETSADSEWSAVIGRGDVLVARRPTRPLAVWAADCAPLALVGSTGAAAVVHAGWRGLAAGIVDHGLDAMRSAGSTQVSAVLGPCIRSCCYEFGERELDLVAAGVGSTAEAVGATTVTGGRSLDVVAAVVAAFGRRGVSVQVDGTCTGCDDRYYSHRVRAELERHAVVVHREPRPRGSSSTDPGGRDD